MSSSVFLEGAVTTADKAVDGDTGVAFHGDYLSQVGSAGFFVNLLER